MGVLQHDPRAHAALRTALRPEMGRRPVHEFAPSWATLLEWAAGGVIELAVVDPWYGTATGPDLGRLLVLQDRLGPRAIIAYTSALRWAPADRIAPQDLRIPLLTVGVDDDVGRFRRAMGSAAASTCLLQDAQRLLDGRLAADQVDLAFAILDPYRAADDLCEVARSLGVGGRELRRRATRSRIPAPRVLHRWSRVFLAVGLHRLGIRNRTTQAACLGYNDATSVNRLFRELLGRPAGTVLGDDEQEARAIQSTMDLVQSA